MPRIGWQNWYFPIEPYRSVSPDEAAHAPAVSAQTVGRMLERGDLATDSGGNIPGAALIGSIKTRAPADIPVLEDGN
jgi:hypothetical protein